MENKNNKHTEEEPYKSNKGLTFKQRIDLVRTTRWVRFGLVSLIFFAFVIWLGSAWVLVFYPLLFDIYITQYVPWSGWKGIKNNFLRTVMSWVDAILYALILVYFIFAYIGQNYQIPSSSLEKSLLVGDYLWVNKMAYGPRVPTTPLHFPLTQNTLPILNCKSYLDNPQIEYKRLKGWRKVERNDIVVFNFPAGDTVALNMQNPDYYSLVAMHGREFVNNNRKVFGDIIYRPVDRRENYVKRCIGLPGETLSIANDVVYINGEALKAPKNVQYNYFIQTNGALIGDDVWENTGVSVDDRHYFDSRDINPLVVPQLGLKVNIDGSVNPIYQAPLTNEMVAKLSALPLVDGIVRVPVQEMLNVFPIEKQYGWNRANMGPFVIPAKGQTISLTLENLPVYERAIRNYEGNTLSVQNGKILINGTETNEYTFKMDYYWMMGDNRDNSADSRYWGFVPEDHVVGTPVFIFMSFDKDKGLFDGKIRFNRIFKSANPDK